MVIAHSKKLLIFSSIALIMLIAVLLLFFLVFLPNRPANVFSEETKVAVEEGSCDDAALEDLETVVSSNNNLNASIEKATMEDVLANCYVYREDYDKAAEYNLVAANTYSELGDEAASQSRIDTAEILSTLNQELVQDPEAVEAEKNFQVPEEFQAN